MADPNNIPQEAQQLKEELNAPPKKDAKEGEKAKKPDIAETDFDKEYKIAQQNENGAGTQSSDPNPVNRKDASAGDKSGSQASGSGSGKVDSIDSPGDSDPDDYMDMAKDVTKNVEANKS